MVKTTRQKEISVQYSATAKCYLGAIDCRKGIRDLPTGSVDLVITSPPYFMGKTYDFSSKLEDFISLHKELLPELTRVTKRGGSICWQVGYYVKNGTITPLDYIIHDIFKVSTELCLRNRIIWTFEHGLHSKNRFSGRHEVVLWYSNGDDYFFDLDRVRVPQKYPGKTFYKGTKKGQFSGHPLGKNPSDVWIIPNVKARHVEKTDHPCQFPVALAQRLVRALCPQGGTVLDPFMGSGTSGVAALVEKRRFVGFETQPSYFDISLQRCLNALEGKIDYRPLDKPILQPSPRMAVARKPSSFKWANPEEI